MVKKYKRYSNRGIRKEFGDITFKDYLNTFGFIFFISASITIIIMILFFAHIEEEKKYYPTTPANIKLHFANGEIYEANISSISIPNSSIGKFGGNTYSSYSGNVLHKAKIDDLNNTDSYRLVNSSVILENGKKYSFYDASEISYNFDRSQ